MNYSKKFYILIETLHIITLKSEGYFFMIYVGYSLLGILAVVILIGLLNGTLLRMGINKYVAVGIMLATIVGAIIPAIFIGARFSFSIGGFLIPFLLCVYLMVAAARKGGLWRGLLAEFTVAAAVFTLIYFIPVNTTALSVIMAIVVGLVAGAVGYLIGRNARLAFSSAIIGVFIAETAVFVVNSIRGFAPALNLGTANMFASIVIAGIVAVALSETVGIFMEGSERHDRIKTVRAERRGVLLNSEQAEFHEVNNSAANEYWAKGYESGIDEVKKVKNVRSDAKEDKKTDGIKIDK